MGSMFPALDIKAPQSPLQQFGEAQQIVAGQQQRQLTALQIQQEQQNITDQHAMTAAMSQWDGKDPGQLPMLTLRNGGSGAAAFKVNQQTQSIRLQASEIAKNEAATNLSQIDVILKTHDEYRGRILNITDNMTDPAAKQTAWAAEYAKEQAAGTPIPPGVTSQYPGDGPARAIANSFALGSQLVKEQQDKQKMALEAWKPAGGELTNVLTGEKTGGISHVEPLNAGLQSRWNVLHPGAKLPDYFTLPANASPADFERIDKIMQQEEGARGTVAQQGVANAIRQQSYDFMTDKLGLKPVQGTDPATGRTVAVPYSQALQMGIKDATELPADDYKKSLAARHWLTLANKQAPAGSDASDMGISQLLDKMDKAGKLGPLAGRWNDFMTTGWGAGDADYAALRTKMDLSSTLLGSVHTGRLGPYLLENLASLAQAKKMDAPTLKSAFNTEVNYVTDRALDPSPPDWSKPARSTKPGAAPTQPSSPQFSRPKPNVVVEQ
jgi:hypothetical protein